MTTAQMLRIEAEPATSNERPIDLVHLSKYTLGNRSLESELLGIFRSQTRIYLGRLENAATDKDWRDAAHSLKGSARSLGAWVLGQHAEDAEKIIEPKAREESLAAIRSEISIVTVFIDRMLLG